MNTDNAPDPAVLLIDAQRLTRQAGGMSVMLLGMTCAGLAAIGLPLTDGTSMNLASLFLFFVVYLAVSANISRWRARHGQPDIRSSAASSEGAGAWWRWKSSKHSVWRINPLVGILILAMAVMIAVLVDKYLDGPRGALGDWFAVAIACNYLLIFRSLRMSEDLLMGLGLGVIGLTVMLMPGIYIDTTARSAWTAIGLLMAVTGASRHLRWRRWVGAHGSETV